MDESFESSIEKQDFVWDRETEEMPADTSMAHSESDDSSSLSEEATRLASESEQSVEAEQARLELDAYEPTETELAKAEFVVKLLENLKAHDINPGLAGGYGLDALYGKLTRGHHDLDLVAGDKELQALDQLMVEAGYTVTSEDLKHRYTYSQQADFAIEVGSAQDLAEQLSLDPNTPIYTHGTLSGRQVQALTAELQSLVATMQDRRAAEQKWADYDPAKRKNQQQILKIIGRPGKNRTKAGID